MQKKILVVDNHPLIVSFMANLLAEAGHQVVTAVDGLSALDVLKSYTPDVIFIDLIMPNISGDKLCRIIRKTPELDEVYIIILSAIAADQKFDYREIGADACIAKGPMNHLASNVLKALDQVDGSRTSRSPDFTYGLDLVHPREITRELLAVKRHFELVLESMAEGILEVTANGRIVYANPVAVRLVGTSEEELLASSLEDVFEGPDRDRVGEILKSKKAFSSNGHQSTSFNIRGRQVYLKALPVSGEALTFIILLNDVTEQKKIEIQLQQAQKLEAVGKLAGGIAHDFNNILTAIMGNISLAKIYASPDDKAYSKLEAAEQASIRAKSLTQQLLPFSKCGTPVKRIIQLQPILKDMTGLFFKDCGASCELSLADDVWPVDADGQQIRTVVQNILTNAAQANKGSGVITVKASNVLIDTNRFFPLKPGRYVAIAIRDQGGGLPEESIARVFDPYFTIDETKKGLELVTAYSIVKKHGGEIVVESEAGKGTTFHIYLPAAEMKPKQEAFGGPKPARAKGRILVMDDEEIIREVVGALLKHLGYSVEYARDGVEALSLYQQSKSSGRPFDTLLMDLTIVDGMGGKETIERLLQIDPEVKAIVSSGYSTDPVMSRFRDYGFVAALDKPYKLNELSAVLDEVLHENGIQDTPDLFGEMRASGDH
ncbi:MAG: response regulator [Syntrophobacteraceae bacterium]|jgi:PAS domain S-box-containing protein|nr:response regulator [Syntrophobacteraceae bacterium]